MVIQGSVRRFGGALVIALALAFALFAVKAVEAQHIPSMCEGLTSGDLMWWLRMCYLYPALLQLLHLTGAL